MLGERVTVPLLGKFVLVGVLVFNVAMFALSNNAGQTAQTSGRADEASGEDAQMGELQRAVVKMGLKVERLEPQLAEISQVLSSHRTNFDTVTASLQQQQERMDQLRMDTNKLVARRQELKHTVGKEASTQGPDGERTGKQTLVLPLGPKDQERFDNLFLSLDKFFDWTSVLEFLIITPSRESDIAKHVRQSTSKLGGLVRVLEDNEVVEQLKRQPTTGWMTQQILKLGVASVVRSAFYLVLDADLVCFKPTSFKDLIVNGRALVNMYDSPHAVTREDWWQNSAKVLAETMNAPLYFGVTPAILAKDIVLSMRHRIEEVNDMAWDSFLLSNVFKMSFTEYCLYGVHAVASGMFGEFHVPTKSGLYNHEKSVFWKNQFPAIDIEEIVRQGAYIPGHFIVLQSNTEIPAAEVREKMGTAFD